MTGFCIQSHQELCSKRKLALASRALAVSIILREEPGRNADNNTIIELAKETIQEYV
jgi:hypothetical protein